MRLAQADIGLPHTDNSLAHAVIDLARADIRITRPDPYLPRRFKAPFVQDNHASISVGPTPARTLFMTLEKIAGNQPLFYNLCRDKNRHC